MFCSWGSSIISLLGKVIAGTLFDETEVLIAVPDAEDVAKNKLDFDVIGHYAPNDIFQLKVNRQLQIKKE